VRVERRKVNPTSRASKWMLAKRTYQGLAPKIKGGKIKKIGEGGLLGPAQKGGPTTEERFQQRKRGRGKGRLEPPQNSVNPPGPKRF